MNRAIVRILHVEAGQDAGPLERWLATARASNAERLERVFIGADAADVRIVRGEPDGMSFGARLRSLARDVTDPGDGLVVLGSGAIPLAKLADVHDFVAVAGSGERRALANNRYSADVLAVGRAELLADVPGLRADNALPRWLDEVAGVPVLDLRRRAHLAMDLDSPLDVLLVGRDGDATSVAGQGGADLEPARSRLEAVAAVATDPHAELLVAGRTSASVLRWLERSTACRVRALVEERGLRAAGRLDSGPDQRPPRSALGLLLDDRGPEALGAIVTELADGALIDSRVLLAHRLGADERRWPTAEERFASDLLLPDRIRDPWLRALTAAAREAPIPILVGGHSLVGPGVRLALGHRR